MKNLAPRGLARIAAQSILATSLLVPAAAFAATSVYAGVSCTSDGPTTTQINGGLFNADSSAGTAKFSCATVRNSTAIAPYTINVSINVMRNWSLTNWDCIFRTIDKAGNVVASASVLIPPRQVGNPANKSVAFSLTNLGVTGRSYSLRCNVPNTYSGDQAGIISYEVVE